MHIWVFFKKRKKKRSRNIRLDSGRIVLYVGVILYSPQHGTLVIIIIIFFYYHSFDHNEHGRWSSIQLRPALSI